MLNFLNEKGKFSPAETPIPKIILKLTITKILIQIDIFLFSESLSKWIQIILYLEKLIDTRYYYFCPFLIFHAFYQIILTDTPFRTTEKLIFYKNN